mmetsp:Transcript_30262/g.77147  ORF Transcript_30262/g.77147 Transcript_30262/m.77147 type:complete len:390 (+) Transcript_30262:262-1431(+)
MLSKPAAMGAAQPRCRQQEKPKVFGGNKRDGSKDSCLAAKTDWEGALLGQHALVQAHHELRVRGGGGAAVLHKVLRAVHLERRPLPHHKALRLQRAARTQRGQHVAHARRHAGALARGLGLDGGEVLRVERRDVAAKHVHAPRAVQRAAAPQHKHAARVQQVRAALVHVRHGQRLRGRQHQRAVRRLDAPVAACVVQRVQIGVDGAAQRLHGCGHELVAHRDALVCVHVLGATAQRGALYGAQRPQRQVAQRVGEQQLAGQARRGRRVEQAELLERGRHLLLQLRARLVQPRPQRPLDRQLGQQRRAGGRVGCAVQVAQLVHHRHRHGVHPDAPLALAVGVQQRALHVRDGPLHHVLLVRDLHGKRLVGVARGQSQQVCRAVEEVAVEG